MRRRTVILSVVVLVVVFAAGAWIRGRGVEPVAVGPGTTTVLAAPADRLTWAPPVLHDPTTVTVTANDRELLLSPDRDYQIVLPSSPITLKGGLVISGGHDVVLVGGEIVTPAAATAPDPKDRRGLMLKGQTGTVHIEGLRISGADLSEGIDIDERLGATVQLENISIATVHGTRATNHADLVQVWAGPSTLRVDGLTGTTQYQGLFLLPQQFLDSAPDSYDLRRIVITSDTNTPEGKAGYLLWTQDSTPWLSASDIVLVDPRQDVSRVVQPLGAWEGSTRLTTSAAGARLPEGRPGIGYVSPGYTVGPTP